MFTIKKIGNNLSPHEVYIYGVNPDSEDVPDIFKCPICFEIPEKNIYQCTQGHVICSRCQVNVRVCPQCRTPLTPDGKGNLIRNRALESLLDSIVFSCPHLSKGCSETVPRTGFKEHVTSCVYNGKCIQLCQHMGLNCDFWTKTLKAGNAAWHFRSSHEATLHNSSSVRIVFDNFYNALHNLQGKNMLHLQNCDGIWAPILLKSYNTHFIIVSILNHADKTVSWMCFHLDSTLDHTQFEVQFKIPTRAEDVTDINWKVPVVPVLNSAHILSVPPIRVSFDLLWDHYLIQGGSLIIEVAVTQICLSNKKQFQNSNPQAIPVVTYDANAIAVRTRISNEFMVVVS